MSTSSADNLGRLVQRVAAFKPDPDNPHDRWMLEAVRIALRCAHQGNFGVGAVVVRENRIIARGYNRVLAPHFGSGKHAESDALDRIERRAKGNHRVHRGSVVYTTLEPCPMCFGRLIIAGPDAVYHGTADTEGGMVMRVDHMPPIFRTIMGDRIFAHSTCSRELSGLCLDIFLTTVRANDERLAAD